MAQPERFKILLAFALLYFFWGSTYLGIGIAVRHIPPELMAGTRFVIAGALMLGWCWWSGRKVAISRRDAVRLAIVGIMLLSVANVTVAFSEQILPTGLAALLVSVVPLWFLVVETWMLKGGDRLATRGVLGLSLGLLGVLVLLWPRLTATAMVGWRELGACIALLLSSLAWAVGSVLSKRLPVQVDPFSASGWQMCFAGVVNLGMAGVLGEYGRVRWTGEGLAAVAYLIVFGSWVGFSAYIWLLHHVPTPKVATYAYVNPVVAVFLGWLVLSERVDAYILTGTAIVVSSVALTTTAKVRTRTNPDKILPVAGRSRS